MCSVPHGHWHTTTFLCGLRTSGLVAPLVLDGAIDGDAFLAYVQQFLVPTLTPGDIVVLDNLSSHKVDGVREAIEAVGAALLYLPPSQPRPEPDRTGFLQAQAAAARSRDPIRRGAMDDNRKAARSLQPRRMRQLHSTLRLCTLRVIPV